MPPKPTEASADDKADSDSDSEDGEKEKKSEDRLDAYAHRRGKLALRRSAGAKVDVQDADLLTPAELNRRRLQQRKRATQHRESDTLARLDRFKQAFGQAETGSVRKQTDETDTTKPPASTKQQGHELVGLAVWKSFTACSYSLEAS